MDEERTKILEMLQQGHITVEQATKLLDALEQANKAETKSASPPEPEPEVTPNIGFKNWAEIGRTLAEQVKTDIGRAFNGFRGFGSGGRSNFTTMTLTRNFLEQMEDGSSLNNYGSLHIADDVSSELLGAKIRRYSNFGSTYGPAPLLRLLQDRCTMNFGSFEEVREGETATTPSPPAPSVPPMPAAQTYPQERVEITGWDLHGWSEWDFHGQYNELAITCHGGNLIFEGTEEDRLELAVSKQVAPGERLPEGWAGEIPISAHQAREGSRLEFELSSQDQQEATRNLTFIFRVPEKVGVIADTAAGNITAQDIGVRVDFRTGGGNISCVDIGGDAVVSSRGGTLTLNDVAGSVNADTAGGDIAVHDIAGNTSVQTAGGAIHIRDIAGNVTLDSGGGDLEVSDIAGNVTGRTGGGEIKMHDISGNVTADTGGGEIRVDDVSGNVQVGTGGGNINVTDVSGNVDANTGAGDIALHDISGNITARTGAGNLDISDIDGDATIETGIGTISLRDISGKVLQQSN